MVLSALCGVIISISIGLLKEYILDKKLQRGGFSVLDIFADVWGAIVGGAVSVILLKIIETNLNS